MHNLTLTNSVIVYYIIIIPIICSNWPDEGNGQHHIQFLVDPITYSPPPPPPMAPPPPKTGLLVLRLP
jgi:hypothetical protein